VSSPYCKTCLNEYQAEKKEHRAYLLRKRNYEKRLTSRSFRCPDCYKRLITNKSTNFAYSAICECGQAIQFTSKGAIALWKGMRIDILKYDATNKDLWYDLRDEFSEIYKAVGSPETGCWIDIKRMLDEN